MFSEIMSVASAACAVLVIAGVLLTMHDLQSVRLADCSNNSGSLRCWCRRIAVTAILGTLGFGQGIVFFSVLLQDGMTTIGMGAFFSQLAIGSVSAWAILTRPLQGTPETICERCPVQQARVIQIALHHKELESTLIE